MPKTAKQARKACRVRFVEPLPKAVPTMATMGPAPSLWDSCRASGGANGQDARATEASSVKDCRLRRTAVTIRCQTKVGITGGKTDLTMCPPSPKGKPPKPYRVAVVKPKASRKQPPQNVRARIAARKAA